MANVDSELVEACYRALLEREPESREVVAGKVEHCPTPEALIREFLGSVEFRDRAQGRIAEDYFRAPPSIDVDVSDAQAAALFKVLQNQWREIGGKDPFWSVLTHDGYRSENINDAAIAHLYETGAEHAALVDLFCARNQVEVPRGVCLELGCGVGRVTKHLSKRFETVIAVDISEGNLKHFRAMAERERLSNVKGVLLETPEQLAELPAFDFFFSTIVLQHNPPPIQKLQLDQMLGKLREGGGFLFQTQTHHPGYRFAVDEYLASPVDTMEMHSLPMHEVLRVIEKHGHNLREVVADMWTGRYGSHTFFGVAPRRERGLFTRFFR
jgi:SAM-dependent methyltransferase